MKKVYISATYNDLKDHREAVGHALRKMGYDVRCMEDYVATDERTDARCITDVAECDFYVGILALRYGWIPPGEQCSITELEFRKAREQSPRTRCLMFLLRDEAPWPQKWIDALHDPDAAAKMREFRGQLNGIASGLFSSAPELVQEVMAAIHMEDSKTWKIALQGEFESCLQHSRVEPLGAPESLSNTDYKLFLSSSSPDDIVATLQTAIRSAGAARLVRVDLSTSGGWWSTRLLLLTALLQDYTQVAKLVFANNGAFIGTCGLSETRRAVGQAFPLIARAMGECLPDRPGFDPTADIPDIVKKFSERLDQIGGENSLAVPVAAHVVSGFRGFNGEKLRFDPNQDQIGRQRELLRKPYQFVAIEEPTSGITIVDRLMFASRVAALALDRV
jgi:Domain of unknown function (DUF4062)